MSTQPRRSIETPIASEYTLQYSKAPNGIVAGKIKGIAMIDPAVASRRSTADVWLKHLWNQLESKFKNISDAFRQFNISKKGQVTFNEFNYILDTLAIRFSKEQTKEMFDAMDGDCDGKLTYPDFVNLAESVRSGEEISHISSTYG